jgi:hypothetical protein
MLLSAVSVLVVAQSISEIPEGLMNKSVYNYRLKGDIKNFEKKLRMASNSRNM